MSKIVFLFLLFFSQTSFSDSAYSGFSSDYAGIINIPPPPYLSSIGKSIPCFELNSYLSGTCFILGWVTQTVFSHSSFQEDRGYYSIPTYSIDFPTVCPYNTSSDVIRVLQTVPNAQWCNTWADYNATCLSDFAKSPFKYEECSGTGFCAVHTSSTLFACSFLPPSFASQQTAITKNKLVSESNSKLGAISNSNLTDSGFLANILSTLKNIFARNEANVALSNNDSASSLLLSDSSIDLSSVSPALQSNGSQCPAGASFTILNQTHHVSFGFICEFAQKIKPLVIAAARVAAAWIVIGAL